MRQKILPCILNKYLYLIHVCLKVLQTFMQVQILMWFGASFKTVLFVAKNYCFLLTFEQSSILVFINQCQYMDCFIIHFSKKQFNRFQNLKSLVGFVIQANGTIEFEEKIFTTFFCVPGSVNNSAIFDIERTR